MPEFQHEREAQGSNEQVAPPLLKKHHHKNKDGKKEKKPSEFRGIPEDSPLPPLVSEKRGLRSSKLSKKRQDEGVTRENIKEIINKEIKESTSKKGELEEVAVDRKREEEVVDRKRSITEVAEPSSPPESSSKRIRMIKHVKDMIMKTEATLHKNSSIVSSAVLLAAMVFTPN